VKQRSQDGERAIMIDFVNNFNVKNPYNNKTGKEKNKALSPNKASLKLVNPEARHIRANYIPFKGMDNSSEAEKIREKQLQEALEFRQKYTTELTSYNNENLFDYSPYSEVADDIALALRADKNINLVYGDGNIPELVAHSFAKKLKNNQFKKHGITPDAVELVVMDTNDLLFNGKNMMKSLKLVNDSREETRLYSILFIKDFQNFINSMERQENPASIFNSREFNRNIKIVGMSKEGIDLSANKHTNKMLEASLKRVELSDPNSKQTGALLKDKNFARQIADLGTVHKLTDEAIDEAVKITKDSGGDNPGKAINLLKYVIADEEPSDDGRKTITPDSVKKVYEAHPDLKDIPISASGRFRVIQDIDIRLKDVGGISGIKGEIEENLLEPLKNPERFKKQHASIPRGFLLHGPPGTGKTYLAKAIAGEAGVPFIPVSGSEFVEQFVGVGAARVRELFSFARKQARKNENKTAIVFIDELDAVGKKRDGSAGGGEEREQTLNQLLVEMDGLEKEKDLNIILIGATNREDLIDPALKRPGRFGGGIKIPNPARSIKARREILEVHAKDKPFKNETQKKELLDTAAKTSAGLSGADLQELLETATRLTCKKGRKIDHITPNDMLEAGLRLKFGPVMEDDSPESQKEQVVFHEWGHAVSSLVANDIYKNEPDYKQPGHVIDLISLDPRGGALGMVVYQDGKNPFWNYNSLMAKLISAYGGYEAEKMLYNTASNGPSGDLESITELATNAVTKWGLGPHTGKIAPATNEVTKDLYNKEIKKDINLFAGTASDIAGKIINFHKSFGEQYVERYKENAGKGGNNLTGKEFRDMYEKWLDKNNKRGELAKLHADIRKTLEEVASIKSEE